MVDGCNLSLRLDLYLEDLNLQTPLPLPIIPWGYLFPPLIKCRLLVERVRTFLNMFGRFLDRSYEPVRAPTLLTCQEAQAGSSGEASHLDFDAC